MQCLYYVYAGVGPSRDPPDPQRGIPQENTLRQKRTILFIFPLISTKNWSKNDKQTKCIVKNSVHTLKHTNFGNLDLAECTTTVKKRAFNENFHVKRM